MSPELVKGITYTSLSDIYSLGVTLFEMVTGKCPYQEITNLFQLQSKIVNEPLPPTNKYYPSVTQRIQNAINIATNKQPEQRFAYCAVFKKYLLEEEPIVLPPTPQAAKREKTKTPLPNTIVQPIEKKNKTGIIVLIIALVGLIGGGIYYYLTQQPPPPPAAPKNKYY